MEIVLDTSVIIGFLRNHEPEARVVDALIGGHVVYVTAITVFELEIGLASHPVQEKLVHTLLDAVEVLPLDTDAARRAGIEERRLRDAGIRIGTADVLIAGICLSRQKRLLTLNAGHFKRIADLKAMTPDQVAL